ncbi:hypothetical protein DB345_05165 [Spartobacteria bacterium LR76]|nr:hypothetical protein DB345_05165 [Spartobacteria bacterium LR76]
MSDIPRKKHSLNPDDSCFPLINLPLGWAVCNLDRLAELRTEKIDPRDAPNEKYIGLEHIEGGGTRRLLGNGRAGDVKSSKNVFYSGDILFGKLRPYLRKVVQVDFSGICSTDILVLKPTQAADPKFLAQLLASPQIAEFGSIRSQGVSLPRIKWKQMAGLKLPLPPLAEQRRIAAQLDHAYIKSQKAREHLAGIPHNLDQSRKSLLARAFSGSLSALNTDRIQNWSVVSLRDVVENLQQGWSPRCHNHPVQGNEWGIIKTTAIQPMIFNGAENKALPARIEPRPLLEIKTGDILITRKGPRARAGVTAFVTDTLPKLMVSDTVYRLRAKRSHCDPKFLAYLLNTPSALKELDQLKAGVSESGVGFTQSQLLSLSFSIPLVDEQIAIVKNLDLAFKRIESAENAYNSAIVALNKLDQTILSDALAGLLAPQDPSDEPASILLNRTLAIKSSILTMKKLRSKPKKNAESIDDIIRSFSGSEFTFEQLQERSTSSYDALKDKIFSMLSEKPALLEQIFDKQRRHLVFKQLP